MDAYVTILIREFSRVLKHLSDLYDIKTAQDFKREYLKIPVDVIRNEMAFSGTIISKIDEQIGKSLKHSILDSYEVQRMDGKGAYIIRKLIRAYISNPQQLPNEYVIRFIKVELVRMLSDENMKKVCDELKNELRDEYSENLNMWKDYQCREALRIISNNPGLFTISYDALIRVIFDYIAGMTDSYATTQHLELY